MSHHDVEKFFDEWDESLDRLKKGKPLDSTDVANILTRIASFFDFPEVNLADDPQANRRRSRRTGRKLV